MIDVIIVNYNTALLTLQTIKSILTSSNEANYYLSVVDNGSDGIDRNKLSDGLKQLKGMYPAVRIDYKELQVNLGFAGANNYFIKENIEDEKTDYFCLLNSDVIVPDGWLDDLKCVNKDIVAPVTNAAGNEQTVVIPYTIEKECKDTYPVKEYARLRKKVFKGYYTPTEYVTFFCVLVKKEVFSKIGFLDERFFPGGYEDDDFCLRASQNGFELAIARDCFVHHYGSSSFTLLDGNKFNASKRRNKTKFENKWKQLLENQKWKLLLSCRDDLKYLNSQMMWPVGG